MDETRNYRVSWSSGRLVEPTLDYSNHSNDVKYFNGRWVDNLMTEVTVNDARIKANVESDQSLIENVARWFIRSFYESICNVSNGVNRSTGQISQAPASERYNGAHATLASSSSSSHGVF